MQDNEAMRRRRQLRRYRYLKIALNRVCACIRNECMAMTSKSPLAAAGANLRKLLAAFLYAFTFWIVRTAQNLARTGNPKHIAQ